MPLCAAGPLSPAHSNVHLKTWLGHRSDLFGHLEQLRGCDAVLLDLAVPRQLSELDPHDRLDEVAELRFVVRVDFLY